MNATVLLLAGSETTATCLSGTTYFLLTHPEVLEKVTAEIRSAFSTDADINIQSVNKLTYLIPVLNESLRMYPPLTSGMVREVPTGGAEIAGRFVPGDVSLVFFFFFLFSRFSKSFLVTIQAHLLKLRP